MVQESHQTYRFIAKVVWYGALYYEKGSSRPGIRHSNPCDAIHVGNALDLERLFPKLSDFTPVVKGKVVPRAQWHPLRAI